jgi:hypothetical protein
MPRRIVIHECEKCLQPFSPKHTNAKRCPPCAMLSSITFARTKKVVKRTCADCTAPFAPLHVQDNKRCGRCAAAALEDQDTVLCSLCNHTRPAVDPRVAVCVYCAKDLKKRSELLRRLIEGQQRRVEKYEDPEAGNRAAMSLWVGVPVLSVSQPAAADEEAEPIYTIAKKPYTEAGLRAMLADPKGKSESTKLEARLVLARLDAERNDDTATPTP